MKQHFKHFDKLTTEKIIEDCRCISFNENKNDIYLLSYKEFIEFLDVEKIENHHAIIAAQFTYGWMPTALKDKNKDISFNDIAQILNNAKNGKDLDDSDYEDLMKKINNSIVGMSKILHFVNPNKYPIWDSNIYFYITQSKYYNANKYGTIEAYKAYTDKIHHIASGIKENKSYKEMIDRLVKDIMHNYGYEISYIRAIELIMFETQRNK